MVERDVQLAPRTVRGAGKRLALLVIVVLVSTLSVLSAPAAQAAQRMDVAETAEERLLARVNQVRAEHGLSALRLKDDLTGHARRQAAAMAGTGTLFHTRDFGAICCWSSIAENVAYGATSASVHRALMNSSGHRANILARGMRAVGIGIVRTADDRIWVTQIFRSPR